MPSHKPRNTGELRHDPRVRYVESHDVPMPAWGRAFRRVTFDIDLSLSPRELTARLGSWASFILSGGDFEQAREDRKILTEMYAPLVEGKDRLTQGQTANRMQIPVRRVKKARERQQELVEKLEEMSRQSHDGESE